MVVAPIQAQAGVIGVIEAINPITGSFDPDALLVMTGIGSLAGTTIQNAQLFEQLQAAHQRYRELFEDSMDPILITDWDGTDPRGQPPGHAAERLFERPAAALRIDQLHEVDWDQTGMHVRNPAAENRTVYEST